ncbi:DNA-binding pseudobarrel domain-containing protein [Tanacetum coccineum]
MSEKPYKFSSKGKRTKVCDIYNNAEDQYMCLERAGMLLGQHDTTITLLDESGVEFKTNYLSARHGLSGGWRGFSFSQKLQQGDILFFRLVGSCRLQVHIVRRYGLEAVEAAFSLLEMHPRVKRTKTLTSGKVKQGKINKGKRMKRSRKNRDGARI